MRDELTRRLNSHLQYVPVFLFRVYHSFIREKWNRIDLLYVIILKLLIVYFIVVIDLLLPITLQSIIVHFANEAAFHREITLINLLS